MKKRLVGCILLFSACATPNLQEGRPTTRRAPNALVGTHPILFGTGVNATALQNDPVYGQTLSKYFKLVTPENELKFAETEPLQGQFNFEAGDSSVDYAQSRGWQVRGTCFVWHNSIPSWLAKGQLLPGTTLTSALQNHIVTEINHFKAAFPGAIRYWDVANELIDTNGGLRTDNPWASISPGTWDYIALAFNTAHQADPAAVLFYNDYGMEEINAKSDGVYTMIKDLLTKGVRIGGIGFQAHMTESTNYNYSSMARNLQRFAELGLIIHITEFDDRLALANSDSPTPAQFTAQAQVYSKMGALCASNPSCQAFVTWDFTDKYSWIPKAFPGWGAADLFDSNYAPKPALNALLSSLNISPSEF